MENLVETTNQIDIIYRDTSNSRIYTAKEQILACINDTRRQAKLTKIKEDRAIHDQQDAMLIDFNAGSPYASFRDAPTPPLMKSSLYGQAWRKFYAENYDLSRVYPRKTPETELIAPFLEAKKNQVIEEGDFQGHQVEVLKAKFVDGVVFTSVGFGEVAEPAIYPYEDCYWDITAEVMRKSGKADYKTCKYFGTKAVMSRGDFEDYLVNKGRNDLAMRVAGGDFVGTEDRKEDQEINYHDPVTVYTFWSIRKDKEFKTVFAGSNAVEIEHFEGDKYPNVFRGQKYIPITVRVFDASGFLFTANSFIGVLKDGAEALKKVLNSFFLSVPRQVNPWNLLVGDENGDMVEDLKLFNSISDIGGTPILSVASADVDIKTIKPASVVNEVLAARDIILDEIGSKIGMQFRIQEKTNQRASIFLEQARDESEAAQMQKQIDKRAVEELIEYSVHLAIEKGEPKDLFVDFGKNGVLDSKVREGKLIYKLLKDWDGYFEADITIEERLTTPQRIAANDNVSVSIQNLYNFIAQIQPESVEEIMPQIDLLNQKIVELKQDKEITKEELVSMFSTYIKRLNGNAQAQQQQELLGGMQKVPEIPNDTLGGEVGQEVPQAIQAAL